MEASSGLGSSLAYSEHPSQYQMQCVNHSNTQIAAPENPSMPTASIPVQAEDYKIWAEQVAEANLRRIELFEKGDRCRLDKTLAWPFGGLLLSSIGSLDFKDGDLRRFRVCKILDGQIAPGHSPLPDN
ncbi:hypothetical protein H6P81_001601 [Aristolochia fimbriata]|uniref:Uncharacterized protein n=1 Tax=Aristolochia fimbriata TaxID=158543 RepID=A0AAV7F804_ARIFI|nr:hypothetical protein H6P81_001601 [Aristolochia fimbriata]